MNLETYLIYLLAILVLTASPGTSVLLCVSTSITQGFRSSVVAALGSLTAIVSVMTLSFTGLGLVIASSEIAFNVIKWIGALYLIVLGVRMFFTEPTQSELDSNKMTDPIKGIASLWFKGFVVGATNPKALVFFTALFPQFINQSQPLLPQYFVLVITFAVMELGWLMFYAQLSARSSKWFVSTARAKLMNRMTGGVFVCAGLLMSTTRRAA